MRLFVYSRFEGGGGVVRGGMMGFAVYELARPSSSDSRFV